MEPVKPKSIKLKINGLIEDDGAVRLPVFREKIDQLCKILADAERQAAHVGQAKSLFKIVDLQYSSAYIENIPFRDGAYVGTIEGVHLLEDLLVKIEEGAESLGGTQSSLVRKVKEICSGYGEKYAGQSLAIGDRSFECDHNLAAKAQQYLDKKHRAYSEVKGALGRVNVHDRNEFYIYLDAGGGSVKCHFEPALLPKIRNALGLTVIARGQMDFIGADVDPSEGYIDDIDVIPEEYQVPAAHEFLGIAPNLTRGDDTESFIRKVRDEWERH